MNPDDISRAMTPIRDGNVVVPYPGIWTDPLDSVQDGRVVLARDDMFSSIVCDLATGAVILADDDGEYRINGSVAAFVECASWYTKAIADVGEIDQLDDESDDALEQVELRFLSRIQAADPGVIDDENGFWTVAAEEIGYGLQGP